MFQTIENNDNKKKNSPDHDWRREIKGVATDKDELVLGIPDIPEIVAVIIEPRTILIALHVEHVEVAARAVIYAERHPYHCPV